MHFVSLSVCVVWMSVAHVCSSYMGARSVCGLNVCGVDVCSEYMDVVGVVSACVFGACMCHVGVCVACVWFIHRCMCVTHLRM